MDQFSTRGYVGPIRVFSATECGQILRHIERNRQAPIDWDKGHAVGSRLFYDIAVHPRILDLVAMALGPNVVVWGISLVHRPPGTSHSWHTDIESSDPAGGMASIWIGLQQTRASSLKLVPFSHRFGRTIQEVAKRHGKHRWEATDSLVDEWARALDARSCVTTPSMSDGDALLFDGRVWHSSSNEADNPGRYALLVQYATPETPVRKPDFNYLDWPFRWVALPQPPCLLVRGEDRTMTNRIVGAPAMERGQRPRLNSRINVQEFPLAQRSDSGWTAYGIFHGSTGQMLDLECHMSVLDSGKSPHDPHRHAEEELLIVLGGEADVIVPEVAESPEGMRRRLQRGDFVYYPARFAHTLQATGTGPAEYLMFKWLDDPAPDRAPLPFGLYRANEDARQQLKGQVLFEGPTSWLRKLHAHVTSLAPGAGYEPHIDAYDVAIVVLEGEVETLGQRVGRNGVIFYAAGEPHGMRNVGSDRASYLVFEFHGRQNGLQRRFSEPAPAPPPPAVSKPRAAEPIDPVIGRVRQIVEIATPVNASLLVISKGDERLLVHDQRKAGHFPQVADGVYAGHYPGSGADAVSHLEDLRRAGARYLVVPCYAFWWLEFYAEFKAHLERHCRAVAVVPDVCAVFELGPVPLDLRVSLRPSI